MKKCPFCAKEIQDEAIKCRHCGAWLDGGRKSQPPPDPLMEKRRSDRFWPILASVTAALLLIAVGLVLLTSNGEKKEEPQKASTDGKYFAVGSTREEVLRIQGPPTFKLEMVWFYEDSQVQFDSDGKVNYIWNYSKNLKIKPEKLP